MLSIIAEFLLVGKTRVPQQAFDLSEDASSLLTCTKSIPSAFRTTAPLKQDRTLRFRNHPHLLAQEATRKKRRKSPANLTLKTPQTPGIQEEQGRISYARYM